MGLMKRLPLTRSPGEVIGLTNTQDGSTILIEIDKIYRHEDKVCITLNLPHNIKFSSITDLRSNKAEVKARRRKMEAFLRHQADPDFYHQDG